MKMNNTKTVEANIGTDELVLIGAAMEREGFRGTPQQYIAFCAVREAKAHIAAKRQKREEVPA